MILKETDPLSDGVRIPRLGLGSVALPKTANPRHSAGSNPRRLKNQTWKGTYV
nr:hypothetical protein [uncultured Oscillibacter sp.]